MFIRQGKFIFRAQLRHKTTPIGFQWHTNNIEIHLKNAFKINLKTSKKTSRNKTVKQVKK